MHTTFDRTRISWIFVALATALFACCLMQVLRTLNHDVGAILQTLVAAGATALIVIGLLEWTHTQASQQRQPLTTLIALLASTAAVILVGMLAHQQAVDARQACTSSGWVYVAHVRIPEINGTTLQVWCNANDGSHHTLELHEK